MSFFFENARQAKLVRCAEKQENLTRFIGYFMDRQSIVANPAPEQLHLSLVARSPLSPAACALIGSMRELAGLGVSVEVLFARLEPIDRISEWLSLAVDAEAPPILLRWAQRLQLLDAHEQLVLGTSITWSGDCMRREPEARDSYELFDTFDAETARRATQSFRALWAASERVPISSFKRAPAALPAAAVAVEAQADSGAIKADAVATVPVTTRH